MSSIPKGNNMLTSGKNIALALSLPKEKNNPHIINDRTLNPIPSVARFPYLARGGA